MDQQATRRLVGVIVLAVLIVFGLAVNAIRGDDDTSDDSDRVVACSEELEAAGPFESGVDPEYDPRMDWDGDGVACE